MEVTLLSWRSVVRKARCDQQASRGPPLLLLGRLRQESGGLLGLVLFRASFAATGLQALWVAQEPDKADRIRAHHGEGAM